MVNEAGFGELLINSYYIGAGFKKDFDTKIDFGANLGRLLGVEAREELKQFINWTVGFLEIDSKKSSYGGLNIFFKKATEDDSGFDGKFIHNGDSGTAWIYLRDVVNDMRELKEIIAHEMVHAKQFCYKKLAKIFKKVDGDIRGCYSWSEGAKLFMTDAMEDEYDNLPWEVEANAMQGVVVDCYENFVKNHY